MSFYSSEAGVKAAWERYVAAKKKSEAKRIALETYRKDCEILNWYQSHPDDIMFTKYPEKLARVKNLMARC